MWHDRAGAGALVLHGEEQPDCIVVFLGFRPAVLYDVDALDAPGKREAVQGASQQANRHGYSRAPGQLHIADSVLAMVSGRSGPVLDAAIIVRPSPLLDLLSRLFDLLWSQAGDLSGNDGRHIEQLCSRLGASSRFVAGARAAERGWL